jgi:hypothetical protein
MPERLVIPDAIENEMVQTVVSARSQARRYRRNALAIFRTDQAGTVEQARGTPCHRSAKGALGSCGIIAMLGGLDVFHPVADPFENRTKRFGHFLSDMGQFVGHPRWHGRLYMP